VDAYSNQPSKNARAPNRAPNILPINIQIMFCFMLKFPQYIFNKISFIIIYLIEKKTKDNYTEKNGRFLDRIIYLNVCFYSPFMLFDECNMFIIQFNLQFLIPILFYANSLFIDYSFDTKIKQTVTWFVFECKMFHR